MKGMKRSVFVALAAGYAVASPSFAQTPYAGMQSRAVKSLSEQQLSDLKSGRGMGMALPAELNGYPGPSHLLELAEPIGLTDPQRQAVQALFDAMKAETIAIGEQLIGQEAELDALFARREATVERIAALTAAIGSTQARLRAAHLRYHLSTLDLLRPAQVQRYAELRGYGGGGGRHHHHGR